jgi:hypothetical protein
MSELKDPAIKIFNNTVEHITGAETMEQAKEIAQLARGYLVGIRVLGIINICQYGAMNDLLGIAVEAANQRIKRTASGVTSTESGKENLHKPSVDEKTEDVKPLASTEGVTEFWLREILIAMKKAHLDSRQSYDILAMVIFHLAGGEQ